MRQSGKKVEIRGTLCLNGETTEMRMLCPNGDTADGWSSGKSAGDVTASNHRFNSERVATATEH